MIKIFFFIIIIINVKNSCAACLLVYLFIYSEFFDEKFHKTFFLKYTLYQLCYIIYLFI